MQRDHVIRVLSEARLGGLQQAANALNTLGRSLNGMQRAAAGLAPAANAATTAVSRQSTANAAAAKSASSAALAYDQLRAAMIRAAAVPIRPAVVAGGPQARSPTGQFAAGPTGTYLNSMERLNRMWLGLPPSIHAASRALDGFIRGSIAVGDQAAVGLRAVGTAADRVAIGVSGAATRMRNAWQSVIHPLRQVRDEEGNLAAGTGVLARAWNALTTSMAGTVPGAIAVASVMRGVATASGAAGTALGLLGRAAGSIGGALGGAVSGGAGAAGRAIGGLVAASQAAVAGFGNLLRASVSLATAGFGAVAAGARTAAGAIGTLAATAAATGAGIANSLGMVSLALSAIGAGAIVAGTGFEQSMNRVFALADTTREEFFGLREQVLQLSREIPLSMAQLAEGFYYVVSAGVAVKDSFDVLRVSAQAAMAGQADLGVVADGVTSVILAYGTANISAKQAADALTRAVVLGKTEYDTFAHSLGRVLPLAAQLDIGFTEVASSLAVMTRLGLNSDEAATALRAALSSLTAPAKETVEQLKAFGEAGFEEISTAAKLRDVMGEKGLVYAFQQLYKAADGNVDVLDRIIPNIRGLTGFLTLANSQADEYAEVVASVAEAQEGAGATAIAFSRAMETTRNQLALTLNLITELGIRFYDSIRDPIQDAARSVNAFLISLVEWQDRNPELFAQISRVSALIIGLTTAMFGLSIAGRFLAPLIGFFAMFGLMSSRGSASLLNFGVIFRAISIPLGILTAAWIGLNMQIDRNVEGLSGLRPWLLSLGGIFENLIDIVKALANNLGTAFASMFGGAQGETRDVGAQFDLLRVRLEILVMDIAALFRRIAPEALEGLRQFASAVVRWVAEVAPRLGIAMLAIASLFWEWIVDATPRAISALREWLGDVVNWIRTTGAPAAGAALSFVADRFVNWIQSIDWQQLRANLWTWATSVGTWIAEDFAPWLGEQVAAAWSNIGGFVTNLPETLENIFPTGFAGGIGASIGRAFAGIGGFLADAIPDILSTLASLTPSLLTWIGQLITQLVPAAARIGEAFFSWVAEVWPNIIGGLDELRGAIVDWIIDAVPAIARQLDAWIDSFSDWVGDIWPGLREGLLGLVETTAAFIGDVAPRILDALGSWTTSFIRWGIRAGVDLLLAIGYAFVDLLEWINSPGRVRSITAALLTWTTAFVQWVITDLTPQLIQALGAMIVAAVGAIVTGAGVLVYELARAIPEAIAGFNDAIREMEGPIAALAHLIEGVLIVSIVRLGVVLAGSIIGQLKTFSAAVAAAMAAMEGGNLRTIIRTAASGGLAAWVAGIGAWTAGIVAALTKAWMSAVAIFTAAGGGLAGGFAVLRAALIRGLALLAGSTLGPIAIAVGLVLFWDDIQDAINNFSEDAHTALQKEVRANGPFTIEAVVDWVLFSNPLDEALNTANLEGRIVKAFKDGFTTLPGTDILLDASDFPRDLLTKPFLDLYDTNVDALQDVIREINANPDQFGGMDVRTAVATAIKNILNSVNAGESGARTVEGPPIHLAPNFQVTDGWQSSLDQTFAQVQEGIWERSREHALETDAFEFFTDVNIRIRNQREAITSAIDQLVVDMNNPQNLADEQLHLEALIDASSASTLAAATELGGEAGAALWRAYNDPELANDPLVQSGADAIVAMIQSRLGILPQDAHETGVKTGAELLAGANVGVAGGEILLPNTAMPMPGADSPVMNQAEKVGQALGNHVALARNQALATHLLPEDLDTLTGGIESGLPAFVLPPPDTSAFEPAGLTAAQQFASGWGAVTALVLAVNTGFIATLIAFLTMSSMRLVPIGMLMGVQLAAGMTSGTARVRSAAIQLTSGATVAFVGLTILAFTWGLNTGLAYANGIRASGAAVREAAISVQRNAAAILQAFSPPGPESPLHDIGDWGFRTMLAWADGITAAKDRVVDAARGVVALAADTLNSSLAISPSVEVNALGSSLSRRPMQAVPIRDNGSIPQGIDPRVSQLLENVVAETRRSNELLSRQVAQDPRAASRLSSRGTLAEVQALIPVRRHG